MKKLRSIISSGIIIILVVLIGCGFYLLLVRSITGNKHPTIFGNLLAVVYSGSMSGTFEVNDIVVIRSQNGYKTGDVICFEEGDSLVTHRIVGEIPEGYITKGDANNTEDIGTVVSESVIGTVIFVIPKIGAVQQFLKSLPGLITSMVIVIIIFFLPEVTRRWKSDIQCGKGGQV